MKLFRGKWRYVIRVIIMLILIALGVHSCNIAVYNVWQSAFPENASILGQLEWKLWLFGTVSLVTFISAIALLVATIKMLNREKRE